MTAFAIIFLSNIGGGIMVVALRNVMESGMQAALLGLGLSQLCLMLLPTLYVPRLQSLPAAKLFRLRPAPAFAYPAALLGMLAIHLIGGCYLLVQKLYLLPPKVYDFFRPSDIAEMHLLTAHTPVEFAAMVVIAALIPGVSEELLFRGVAQRSLERELTPARAIILTSILFAVIHLQPINLVVLFGLACFLGYLAWKTGSIFPSMLAHASFNASSLLIAYLYSDLPDSTGSAASRHATELALVKMLLPTAISIIILLLVIGRLRQLPAESHEPHIGAPDAGNSESNNLPNQLS
jgi:membrane protease YdiL (CAAX protease family)